MKIWKNSIDKLVYIEGVTFGSAEDFVYSRNGDLFSIIRQHTGYSEVDEIHFSEFQDETGSSFVDATSFQTYLDESVVVPESFVTRKAITNYRSSYESDGYIYSGAPRKKDLTQSICKTILLDLIPIQIDNANKEGYYVPWETTKNRPFTN